MARTAMLNPDTEDLKDLLGNGKAYQVPPYQRDYSWQQEHWEDLWEDFLALESHGDDHYMGAIVLQEQDRKQYWIIDGQQRLATLTIVILAAVDILQDMASRGIDAEDNKDRAELLQSRFVGDRDPVSLRVAGKLRLNAHDDPFFQHNLTQRIPPVGGVRRLSDSEKKLWQCFDFFRAKMADRFGPEQRGDAVAKFINELVTERMMFVSLRVRDQLSAYTIFETLNARGLELTETDLLKNYLLSLAHSLSSSQMESILELWSRITNLVGGARFPEFLRYHLNSRQPYVREKALFKTVKASVRDLTQVFGLLYELERDAVWFEALCDHTSEFWLDYSGAREFVRVLNLLGVTQFIPLVFAAKNLPPQELCDVLRYCMVVSVRFNGVSRRSTHALEPTYNQAALAARATAQNKLAAIRQALQPVYIPDNEFVDAFASLQLNHKGKSGKKLRYFLCELERQIAPKEISDATLDATIEHILPESFSESWSDAFARTDHERFVERIGNYTLLEAGLNRAIGQQSFEEKKDTYGRSQFELTRELASVAEWTADRIDQRQRKLAKVATSIWRIDF